MVLMKALQKHQHIIHLRAAKSISSTYVANTLLFVLLLCVRSGHNIRTICLFWQLTIGLLYVVRVELHDTAKDEVHQILKLSWENV